METILGRIDQIENESIDERCNKIKEVIQEAMITKEVKIRRRKAFRTQGLLVGQKLYKKETSTEEDISKVEERKIKFGILDYRKEGFQTVVEAKKKKNMRKRKNN